MELGHLPYKKATFEDYVGVRGLEKYGKKKWRRFVADVVKRLVGALEPEDVVLGGGNVHKLKKLPPGCRVGDNSNAFRGGFRLWEQADGSKHFHCIGRRIPRFKTKLGRFDYEKEPNDATRNDWAGPDGRQHGAPAYPGWTSMRRL
jgi:hypothetical protein